MLQFQGGHGCRDRDRNVDGDSDGEIIKRDTKGDDTNKIKSSDVEKKREAEKSKKTHKGGQTKSAKRFDKTEEEDFDLPSPKRRKTEI